MTQKQLLALGALATFAFTACEDDLPNEPETVAPQLIITNVNQAGTVSGYVTDASTVEVTIGLLTASLSDSGRNLDGEQSFSISGVDLSATNFKVIATDEWDNTTELDFVNKTASFSPAVTMRLNNTGIASVATDLESEIDAMNLRTTLAPNSAIPAFVLYDDNGAPEYEFYTTTINTDYNLENTNLSLISIATNDDKAHYDVEASIDLVKVKFIIPDVFLGFDAVYTATVDRAIITGQVDISADKSIIVSSDTLNSNVAFTNYEYKITDDLIGWDFTGFVDDTEQAVKDGLLSAIDTYVKEDLATLLSATSYTFNDLPLNGGFINISALPTLAASDDLGMDMALSGHSQASTLDSSLPGALGSHYVSTVLPSVSQRALAFHLATTLSSNFLNQALLAAYETGATTIEGTFSSYDYIITPLSPAYLEVQSQNGDLGSFNIENFRVDLKQSGLKLATAYVNVNIALNEDTIGISEGNLQVNLEQAQFNIDIIYVELFNIPVNEDTKTYLEDYVQNILPEILPELTASLNSLPVPTLAGYSVNLVETFATSSDKGHLAMTGNIVPLTLTATAQAPDTSAYLASVPSSVAAASSSTATSTIQAPITLEFSGTNPSTEPLKYRYQIDGGSWSVYSSKTSVTLNNIQAGAHTLTVCSRTAAMVVDPTCTELSFYK